MQNNIKEIKERSPNDISSEDSQTPFYKSNYIYTLLTVSREPEIL